MQDLKEYGTRTKENRGTGFNRKSNVLVSSTVCRINTNSFHKCFSQYDKKRSYHKQLLGYMGREREKKHNSEKWL